MQKSPEQKERSMKRQRMETLVKENIKYAQQKQKKYCDNKHAHLQVLTWDFVKMKVVKQKKRKGGYLDFHWQGPS